MRHGAGPNGVMRTLGTYMLGSGATFGYCLMKCDSFGWIGLTCSSFFMSIGSTIRTDTTTQQAVEAFARRRTYIMPRQRFAQKNHSSPWSCGTSREMTSYKDDSLQGAPRYGEIVNGTSRRSRLTIRRNQERNGIECYVQYLWITMLQIPTITWRINSRKQFRGLLVVRETILLHWVQFA